MSFARYVPLSLFRVLRFFICVSRGTPCSMRCASNVAQGSARYFARNALCSTRCPVMLRVVRHASCVAISGFCALRN